MDASRHVGSDNNGSIDHSPQEDEIEDVEDNPERPGKIMVNDGDVDADGIPDFADGYNRDGKPVELPMGLKILKEKK